jgi:NADH-quinone oxidoreductase subunit C
MNVEELKIKFTELFSDAVFEENTEWLTVNIDAINLKTVAATLRNDESFKFDFLFCITCIDWKTHLTMVYHFNSTIFRHNIVLKAKLNVVTPAIETLSNIWRTAEFHEREVYEMFGVDFINHPDLRLLILPDGWEGKNPMRKDFDDPVNMIRL